MKDGATDEYKYKIIEIEWWKGRPHQVYTHDGATTIHSYDVEWDQSGRGYYHGSGCWGGPGIKSPKLGQLPSAVRTLGDLVVYYNLVCGATAYCKICDAHMLADELCEHLYWSEEHGCWDGPGSNEAGVGSEEEGFRENAI